MPTRVALGRVGRPLNWYVRHHMHTPAVTPAADIRNPKVWLKAVLGLAGDNVCYLGLC